MYEMQGNKNLLKTTSEQQHQIIVPTYTELIKSIETKTEEL